MKSIVCFILIFGASLTSRGQGTSLISTSSPKQEKKHSFAWSTSLLGLDQNNEEEQKKLVSFNLKLKGLSQLHPHLQMSFRGSLRLQTGSSQTLEASDSDNNITLEQAGLHYSPSSYFQLSAGALNQETIHSQIFVDSLPFPAARVLTKFRVSESIATGFFLESAIPTNSSLSTNTQEFEKTPGLQTAGLHFQAGKNRDSHLKVKASAFKWENLPASVAGKSYERGNTVNLYSEELGTFQYKYQGIDSDIKGQIALSETLFLIGDAQYVKNDGAPSQLNTAYSIGGGFTLLDSGNAYSITAQNFRTEKDATVAFYGPTTLFNTNRNGYAGQFKVDFKKYDFAITARYTEAELIFENPVQSREKSVFLKLETSYADL